MSAELFKGIRVVILQSWTLLWHKFFKQSWGRLALTHFLSLIFFDVLIPAGLIYMYIANCVMGRDITRKPRTNEEDGQYTIYGAKNLSFNDPRYMKETMNKLMTNLLLPLSFFLYARKIIGQVVGEKEKGLFEYLQINGMRLTAYNTALVLHETFINGVLICLVTDVIAYKRLKIGKQLLVIELIQFNISTLLFIMGMTAFCLLISKGFNTSGFATQIGSIAYLAPVLFSLVVRVIEIKHNFAKAANEEFAKSFGIEKDERKRQQEVDEQKKLREMIGEQEPEDIIGENEQKHAKGDTPFDRFKKVGQQKHNSSEQNEEQFIEDHEAYWEQIAQKSLNLYPHTPYCDISMAIFQTDTSEKEKLGYEFYQPLVYQFADFLWIFILIFILENKNYFSKFLKKIRNTPNIPQDKQEIDDIETELTDLKDGENEDSKLLDNSQKQNLSNRKNQQKKTLSQKETFNKTPSVQFKKMSKNYGQFQAVDSLSLNLFKDEIFCFLGHNGAGKTTSLKVLIGQEAPSKGTILINSQKEQLDIRNDYETAQSMMGTCSQHDILFENLSVRQHIYLFFKMKSCLITQNEDIKQQLCESELIKKVDSLINTVDLEPHQHKEAQNLSGGMRRRLSIALALVSPSNSSSIVILDEPTTGLDAMVRDQVWQLIKKLRTNRCIVMTTQHLQEAEELADQVALLDMGKLISTGSVHQIKKQFGIGYQLTIQHGQSNEQLSLFKQKIFEYIPSATITINNQVTYHLPFHCDTKFSLLFKELEKLETKFTLKQTSLEDAFLNFADFQKKDKNTKNEDLQNFNKPDGLQEYQGWRLFLLQTQSMFLRRWYGFKRDYRMWLLMIIPSALIWILLMFGLRREHTIRQNMAISTQVLSKNETLAKLAGVGQEGLEGVFAGSKLASLTDGNTLNQLIQGMGFLSNSENRERSLNLNSLSKVFMNATSSNPSIELLLKNAFSIQDKLPSDDQNETDKDLQELLQIIKDGIKEDLKIETPFEMVAFGLKLMAETQNPIQNSKEQRQMRLLAKKIERRMQAFFEKKMQPIIFQMAKEQSQLLMLEGIRYMKEVIYLVWAIFSLAMCSGVAVETPVLERQTGLRQYLNIIGLNQKAYWLGNFLFDLILFAIQAVLMVYLIYPLKLVGFQQNVKELIAIFAFFGPTHILFSYLISFCFEQPQSALKFISFVYLLSGFILPFLLKIISLGLDRCDGGFYVMSSFTSQMIPLQPFSQGIMDLVQRGHWAFFQIQEEQKKQNSFSRSFEKLKAKGEKLSPMQQMFDDWQKCDGFVKDVPTALQALSFGCVTWIILLLVIEHVKLHFYRNSEKSYTSSKEISDQNLVLQTNRLKKVYQGGIKAVKSLSFNLKSEGEILGLLGANGAGKSSTFNMVTMQIKRTSGDIKIFNQPIQQISHLQKVNITAQSDILWPYLSIKEHFRVISMVQGKPEFEERFQKLKRILEIDEDHKFPAILSGGNKRKLSSALTLLTSPSLAYFDEPTVGLDPVARRNLLDLIKHCGASVLFTTHRLDEAEYLCNRVAIMKHGLIVYDGPIDQIKENLPSLFGSCQALVLARYPTQDLTRRIPYLEIDQESSDQILYKIIPRGGNSSIPLSTIFEDICKLRSEGIISDFSYYEPSLHHAFVALNQQVSV